jgi:AcrR family transcriptional regulator
VARPRSEDKKLALLEAAAEAIAEAGIGASTALVARKAGVAEGTLFRYFPTKDDLYNALYLHLKHGFCQPLTANLDRSGEPKAITRYIWESYIEWGLRNPLANQAMRQLAVSEKITEATRQTVNEMYPELRNLCEQSIAPVFLSTPWRAFGDALFFTLAQTTIDFASREPARAKELIAVGFDAMWRALGVN